MKLTKKISIALLVMLVGFSSCDDQFDLDLQLNPNSPTEESADVDLFFQAIQLNVAGFFNTSSNLTMPAVRMTAMTGGNNYENAWTPLSFNGMWNSAYATIFPDVNTMVTLAEEREQFVHVGAAQIMQGYVLLTMVDFFGDIPWSEAFQGVTNPSPLSDDDQSVYTVAMGLLDEGIANMGRVSRGTPSNDFFYDGDTDAWVKAANTFRMRAMLNMGDMAGFNAIVAGGNFISAPEDDFVFQYSTNRVNPNARHPFYNEQYEVGNGRYHSNAFMYEMALRKSVPDPRVRYYFYRQDLNPADADQFTLDCPAAPRPFHYPNDMPFCLATLDASTPAMGTYWGRDHGNNDGIPPDGRLRTVWGVYPAGGKFDADEGTHVKRAGTDGALGRGIAPIMMSSFVDFMRAEVAMNNGDIAATRALLEAGMRNSIDRVMSFSADIGTIDPAFTPAVADIDAYVAEVLGNFDTATDDAARMDIIQQENHITLFGNGYEAYNAYRRTAAPRNLQFGREAELREFPRLMLYPADYVNLNASITTNRVISQQVFWDNLPAGALD